MTLQRLVNFFADHNKHELQAEFTDKEMFMHCLTCGWLLFRIPVRRRRR